MKCNYFAAKNEIEKATCSIMLYPGVEANPAGADLQRGVEGLAHLAGFTELDFHECQTENASSEL